MKKEILPYRIAISSIVIGMLFFSVILYWLLAPQEVLRFLEGNGDIHQDKVKAGDYIGVRQHYCKYNNLPSEVNRQFVDTIIYQVPTVINNRGVQCKDVIEEIYVPKVLAPGIYYINTTISFKVNPIRTATYTVTTKKFEVIK